MAEKATTQEVVTSGAQVQIDAHVIRQLGDQLVTDAEQALIELIKNCWDADATKARVSIEPDFQDEDDPASGIGRIVVKDDGCGMDRGSIERGWLTISLSPKREMKLLGKTTSGLHRTPLGDKGLGRLGTMKLGNIVRITTHHDKNEPGHFVSLSWSDFKSGKLLSNVPITLKAIPSSNETGTRVEVRGLVDRDYWRGERRLRDLQVRLSTLVSPFEDFSQFKLTVSVDGKSISLDKLSAKLRDSATARFACLWDDENLVCKARFKVSLFDTGDGAYARWVETDGGKALFAFLEKLPASEGFGLAKPKSNDWFVKLTRQWSWKELAGKKQGAAASSKPGPFVAELDAFTLDSDAHESSTFSNLQDYRRFIKAQAGVRVYRDGFGIRMPEDWVGLGKSWTSGRSYYGLRPNNTIGYVAISAKGNSQLEEKSDREGFIDSPAVRGFNELTGEFVRFANDALTFLRRSYVDFREERNAEEATLPTKWEPADAVERLKGISKSAKDKRKSVEKSTEARRATLQKVQTHLSKVLSAPSLSGKAHAELAEALAQFARVMKEFEAQKSELDELVSQIADEEKLAELILDRFGQLKGQIDDVYETVGLGLVAQALAHDLHAIVDDLLVRTQKVGRRVKALNDPHVAGYLEAVRATANSVRKQLTLLDPMLRSARETRQTVSLAQFINEFVELRKERLDRFAIASPVERLQDASITINRGRLLQVFDNLFRNSEYWLRQYSVVHPKAELSIAVQIDGSVVVVSDTGPGVKPALERTLFDLFVTDKPRGEGNGLGLFIVKQLLEAEGCSVRLGGERNKAGRRFQFVLDFTGAKSE